MPDDNQVSPITTCDRPRCRHSAQDHKGRHEGDGPYPCGVEGCPCNGLRVERAGGLVTRWPQ